MGNDSDGDLEALAVTGISTALGFPIPPTIAKSVFKSLGALVGSGTGYLTARIDAKTAEMQAASQAKIAMTKKVGRMAVQAAGKDPDLAERAKNRLLESSLRTQKNREDVASGALEDLKALPPTQDAAEEVDEDWLNVFARAAEIRTNDDTKAYFSKILAGEIRKPGSFGPATIEVLSRLSRADAILFQRFCGMTLVDEQGVGRFLFAAPFGQPGTNALAGVGFDFSTLGRLADAGLIRTDFTSHITLPPIFLGLSLIGGRRLMCVPSQGSLRSGPAFQPQQGSALFLTTAGAELCRIVHPVPSELYFARLTEWLGQHGLHPPPPAPPPASAPTA